MQRNDEEKGFPGDAGFPVVGIGASAGGLEAFAQLLGQLPNDTGMGFVLVQHLDPQHDSKLSDLLAKSTEMPVVEAVQNQPVQPNHVYVIPPNKTLRIVQGALELEPRGEGRGPHLTIDSFFKSLANERKTGAIGVILSGTGSDGTLGLDEIKAAGGITFAQDDHTARYTGIPQSAIRSGCVDLVLSPAEIASELGRLGKHPYVVPTHVDASASPVEKDEDQFKRILRLRHVAFKVDFSDYRDTTLKRRITRRMVVHTRDSLADYAEHLAQDRGELEALYQDILINVTSFFREPETFETLKTRVFPEIIANKEPTAPIRIWVAGCSTGQEAYSLAMVLVEFLDEQTTRPAIQIFATDLSDTVSLFKARDGLYPENIEAEVSPERLRRFFTKEDGQYRISKALREMVVFARHNVAADPPFSHMDLVSCRNLLIYLAPLLQKRVVPTFHYALNPTGFLVLGHSETIGAFTDLFSAVDAANRIYAKKPMVARQYPHFQVRERRWMGEGPTSTSGVRPPSPTDWQHEADRVLIGQYVPPGVLVNENLDILQFRGETGAYLSPAPGEPNLNLLKMAREGLFLAVRGALLECQQQGTAIHKQGVRVRGESVDREISLHVLPLKLPHAGERCYLVLFEESLRHMAPPVEPIRTASADGEGDEVNLLRQELAATREYLQSIIEQQDASNEELKSANEEVLSSNEELQSTNEELETAKEELQSVNEELTTVNEQLQSRNVALARLNDDMTNLLGSSGVPTVVVGADLRIRRFTPAAGKVLDLLPSDIGRPIGNLSLALETSFLTRLISEVIDSIQMKAREVQDKGGCWFALRIHPYRTSDNRIDGAVLVLSDMDQLKRSEQEAQTALAYAEAILRTTRGALLVLHGDLRVNTANQAFYETFHMTPQETEGRALYELGDGQWDIPELRRLLEDTLTKNTLLSDFEVDWNLPGTGFRTMLLNALRLNMAPSSTELILLAIEDITERKRNEIALKEADQRKNEFLAMLAHELRTPLAPILNAVTLLRTHGISTEAAASASAIMDRQLRLMVRLIDDLMDVSRISRGGLRLRKQGMDLTSAVSSAAESVRPLFEGMGQDLAVRLPSQPIYVDGDAQRLGQVVSNLLINAYKFTDRGGHIDLAVAKDGEEAVIRVCDTGIGIAADMLPRIFDMFMQADSSADRSRSGLGIGLGLVKTVVEMHGGTVKVTSNGLGQGSAFIVRLPMLPKAPKSPAPDAKLTKHATTPRRILIVDDNPDSVDSLAMLLELGGHEVHTAHDGVEAVEMAGRILPELILLDLGLPRLNGFEAARQIRKTPGGKAIVLAALTGLGQEDDRRRSEEAGFDVHLIKPVDPEALDSVLAMIDTRLVQARRS